MKITHCKLIVTNIENKLLKLKQRIITEKNCSDTLFIFSLLFILKI